MASLKNSKNKQAEKPHDTNGVVEPSVAAKHRVIAKKLIKKASLIVAVLLVMGAGLWLALAGDTHDTKSDIVFEIEGRSFGKDEVDQYMSYATNTLNKSRADAIKDLFEMQKKKIAAEQLGIKASDEDVKTSYNKLGYDQGVDSPWIDLAAYLLAVDDQIQALDNGGIKGYSYIFYFGDKIAPRIFDAKPEGWGDPVLIEADRSYARGRADFYHAQLKDNKMNPEQILAEIKADSRLGFNGQAGANLSTKFGYDINKPWHEQVFYESVKGTVEGLADSQISEVLPGKTASVEEPKSDDDYHETFFYFASVNEKLLTMKSQLLTEKISALDARLYGEAR